MSRKLLPAVIPLILAVRAAPQSGGVREDKSPHKSGFVTVSVPVEKHRALSEGSGQWAGRGYARHTSLFLQRPKAEG